MKVNKKIKCWGCRNLDKSDINDYDTVSFCGEGHETEEDLSNGEIHPVGICDNFEPIIKKSVEEQL